jgi:protein required for attachment to host cells
MLSIRSERPIEEARYIMLPMARREIEILLDTPDQHDYVVSAYADLTVQDGFNRYMDRHLRNQARAASEALSEAKARKDLDTNMAVIRDAVHAQVQADPGTRGVVVFSSVARGLRQVIPLDCPVENQLIIDEEPFLLPLLVHWYGEPLYLIALFDSDEAHLFEARHGRPRPVDDLQREDADQDIQRDKPRFTAKKRLASARHERLQGPEDERFLHDLAGAIGEQWAKNDYAGLILLGQSQHTSVVRKLLDRELEALVVGEAPHAMTTRPDDLADDVNRLVDDWHARRERDILTELNERWTQNHMVANGPTDVLDALQQGRAVQVLLGTRRDLPGAHCTNCGYRLGAPVAVCPYCQARCRSVNAIQGIMRLAMRHRVPVVLLHPAAKSDPLEKAGGVAAFLRAEANWAPSAEVARQTEGHTQAV